MLKFQIQKCRRSGRRNKPSYRLSASRCPTRPNQSPLREKRRCASQLSVAAATRASVRPRVFSSQEAQRAFRNSSSFVQSALISTLRKESRGSPRLLTALGESFDDRERGDFRCFLRAQMKVLRCCHLGWQGFIHSWSSVTVFSPSTAKSLSHVKRRLRICVSRTDRKSVV